MARGRMKFVIDSLVPKSFILEALDLKTAGHMAKTLQMKGEILLSVKALVLWEEHEKIRAQGGVPDAVTT